MELGDAPGTEHVNKEHVGEEQVEEGEVEEEEDQESLEDGEDFVDASG